MLLDGDRGPLNTEQREYVDIAQQCSQRLLTLTNNLLDATRIETGRVELGLAPQDLPILVETVVMEHAPELEAKRQQVILRTEAGLPPALCDSVRTMQVISNLLSNASKYSAPETLIIITLSLAQTEGFLQVTVKDNGIGIPAEDQLSLFNCFYRADNGSRVNGHGMGLGLYIARALVELHDGSIWVESQLNEGSTFYVTLPIASDAVSTPDTVDEIDIQALLQAANLDALFDMEMDEALAINALLNLPLQKELAHTMH
jgi:signal transduction histidine kinase